MLKSSILIFFMMSTSTNSMFRGQLKFFLCHLIVYVVHFKKNLHIFAQIRILWRKSRLKPRVALLGAARRDRSALAMYQDTRFTARGETF